MNIPNQFLENFTAWAQEQSSIRGVSVVGSYARGTARANSDIDLVILCQNPKDFLDNQAWVQQWGEVQSSNEEDYGALTSLRVFYSSGLEVEFGLTSTEWASVPVDPGTREVVSDGMKILHDPESLFEQLEKAVVS